MMTDNLNILLSFITNSHWASGWFIDDYELGVLFILDAISMYLTNPTENVLDYLRGLDIPDRLKRGAIDCLTDLENQLQKPYESARIINQ